MAPAPDAPAADGDGSARRWRAVRATAAALLGIGLLWLGAPRLFAALMLLPGDRFVDAVGERLNAEQIAAVVRSREEARRFAAAAVIEIQLGQAELQAAEAAPTGTPERRLRLDAAVGALRRGLAQGPRDTFGWASLAHALALRDGVNPAAVDAWRMSILTAPAEPLLVLWRAGFGAGALRLLDREDRERLARQMRHAWRFDREGLVRMAKERGLQLVLRRVLSGEPDAAELNRLLSRP